jgi:fucose 4-O-acetylase-like acetyltransferase
MRNRTVDVAKGIAGVFVVLGHTLAFRYQEGALLLLTHLTTPLYLFLSGVFIKVDRPWRQAVMRLLDALLKPYFVVLLAWGRGMLSTETLIGLIIWLGCCTVLGRRLC